MSLDVPEQLLTPENSRSETSSNNENASTDEKLAGRRRSTRVVRASLQATESLANTPAKSDEPKTASSQAYVDSLAKSKRSRSSLRHSIAVMESSLRNGTALPDVDTLANDQSMVPDTPISNSSQEPVSDELNPPLSQRTLRHRVEKALGKDEKQTMETEHKIASRGSMRRSTRLSLVEKASDILERTSSVLGKRQRGQADTKKEVSRRASLRPRTLAPAKEETPAPTAEAPQPKKRRVSESDVSKLQKKEPSPPQEEIKPVTPKYKPKRWLAHGLYTGQEPSDSPPKQRQSKNSAKTGTGPLNRRLLPMPMFAGSRLVKHGRDYRLPFDIFSPLPPGQPKPDEWRKTNKSRFPILIRYPDSP
jgi:histone-lysine N-methyltransferase ASH1L